MSGKVLGDYSTLRESVDDAINYESGGRRYLILVTGAHGDGPEYGHGIDTATTLGTAHSGADWAATNGKHAIVVDLADVLRLPWSRLPVVYDTLKD